MGALQSGEPVNQIVNYTEYYRVMHDFIVHPKRMLDMLLAPGEDA